MLNSVVLQLRTAQHQHRGIIMKKKYIYTYKKTSIKLLKINNKKSTTVVFLSKGHFVQLSFSLEIAIGSRIVVHDLGLGVDVLGRVSFLRLGFEKV